MWSLSINYKVTQKSNLIWHIGLQSQCVKDFDIHVISVIIKKCILWKHVDSIHKRVHHLCDQCEYKATYKIYLKQHEESKHEGVCYSCDKCDFKIKWKEDLNQHLKSYCPNWHKITIRHISNHLFKNQIKSNQIY